MAYLNKEETNQLKGWKNQILDDNCKIKILKIEACINGIEERYLSVALYDEDGNILSEESSDNYIDLAKDYEKIDSMKKDAMELRREICRKMDLYTKEIEIKETIV